MSALKPGRRPADYPGVSSMRLKTPSAAASIPELDDGRPEALRFLRPEPPPLSDAARYYALAEEKRFYSNGGPCHELLATRLAQYVGDVICIPVSNCTLGLMAALRVICGEPTPGRRLVAVPSFTFTASASAIRWAGFEPLFVDIAPDSWQLDPAALAAALAAHPGAVAGVMGCSTFGTPAPSAFRDRWRALCDEHAVPLLIDSAAGFGAVDDRGRLLGGQGETEVFSFHATKPFAVGEGGAIVTSDPAVAEGVRQMINFGLDPVLRTSVTAGLNAKMSELHCAMGLAMLDRYDEALGRRRATAAHLRALVAAHPVSYQGGSAGSTWQGFQLTLPTAEHRRRAESLAAAGNIEARTYFDPPLHRHPAHAAAPVAGTLAVTDDVGARSLSLPMANTLGPRQTARIAALLDAVFA
ncbi:MAG TPA: aminotransferase class I/II-fold pyridoxal phosphate-dependent enzyme [Solirubrobacteraceae bacterium]|nr:aminotransferase class I/II-fold pyridoxal phosphate-dependent enzyme [Solirubrobacteraceae bacterium]